MLNFKKITSYLIFFFLLGIVVLSVSWKKRDTKVVAKKAFSYFDEKPDFYWFSIRIQIEVRNNTFKMLGATGGVRYGKQISFEKALWHGLSRRQIAIGPFMSKKEAENARQLYKPNKDKIKLNKLKEVPAQINWFAITFEESPRLRIFVLRRAPGAVATGSLNFFISTFYQLLQVKQISVGPFEDYQQAELAKRLYRMNE